MSLRFRSKVRTAVSLARQDLRDTRAKRLVLQGRDFLANQNRERALDCAREALTIYNDCNDAYHLMASVFMPGDDYLTLLSRFHDFLRPDGYLEIGVSTGESLALAHPRTTAVGIDPNPKIAKKIRSRAKLYPITSDDFFSSYDLLNELGVQRLSLAFIDGLHQFEQVLKDFINTERRSDSSTVVLMHDCMPVARVLAARTPLTDLWTGDVWKIIPCLKKYRADLSISVIPAAPSGLSLITNLDPHSTVLQDNFDSIVQEYIESDLSYDYLDLGEHDPEKVVPALGTNDWQQISRELPSCFTSA